MSFAQQRAALVAMREDMKSLREESDKSRKSISELAENGTDEMNSMLEYVRYLQQVLPEQFGKLGINGGEMISDGIRANLLDLYQKLKSKAGDPFAKKLADMVLAMYRQFGGDWNSTRDDGKPKRKSSMGDDVASGRMK